MSTKLWYMLTWYILHAGTEVCHQKKINLIKTIKIHEFLKIHENKTQTDRQFKKSMHWVKRLLSIHDTNHATE